VLPVLVHGDAAFAGQGVVMETLALAQTRGYFTGGTVHLVINNQIGFTTSDPRDSRSTLYCTDVVKMVEAPVLHVNGDDPEAVVLCTQLAMDYRQQFRKDVVVDIVCFRKLGHNEQDTPSLTQPLMYKKIAVHPGTRRLYGDKLVTQGVLPETGPDEMVKAFRSAMDEGRHTVDPVLTNFKSKYAVDRAPFLGKKWTDAADTALPLAEIRRLSERITTVPDNFKVHPLVEKVLADRRHGDDASAMLAWPDSPLPEPLKDLEVARLIATHHHERWDGQGYPGRLAGARIPLPARLMAVAEAYPDLKANQNMLQLSEELTSTENRVAFARQAYNDAVMIYNTSRESFPRNIIAGMFNFQPATLYEIEDARQREAPKVSFT
jgi:2-oxoglutarate dehydrogenase complex dehydrogenase (E1) component-like enzyme